MLLSRLGDGPFPLCPLVLKPILFMTLIWGTDESTLRSLKSRVHGYGACLSVSAAKKDPPRAPEYAEGAVLRVSRVASSSVATTIIEQLVWDVWVVQYNKAMAGPTETKDMHIW